MPAVERTATLNSAVLKGYKLSSYTSASGSDVTRIELELGEQVTADVNDESDGLQILLSGGGPPRSTAPAAAIAPASSPALAVPASAAPKPRWWKRPIRRIRFRTAAPREGCGALCRQSRLPQRVLPASRRRLWRSPVAPATALAPATIRNISVQRGQGTMDVIIDGPRTQRSHFC